MDGLPPLDADSAAAYQALRQALREGGQRQRQAEEDAWQLGRRLREKNIPSVSREFTVDQNGLMVLA